MALEQGKPDRHWWIYAVLLPFILNVAGLLVFGAAYVGAAMRQQTLSVTQQEQMLFALYVIVFTVQVVAAAGLIVERKRRGISLAALVSPIGPPRHFRWMPAVLIFVAFNGLFAAYVLITVVLRGAWPSLNHLDAWQRVFMLIAIPIQAGFCEELIWRSHLIPQFELRGRRTRAAIWLSALSFATIHGFFLPDKLIVTLLFGLLAGVYFARERNALPLMVSHWFVDVWSFGLSVL
jgi:membrane protease YdiL (CAAX protease family)